MALCINSPTDWSLDKRFFDQCTASCCKQDVNLIIITAKKFRRCDWLRESLFPGNSGITAKDQWYNKVTMTMRTQLRFYFQKHGSKIPGNGNTKVRHQSSNQNTKLIKVKTIKTWLKCLDMKRLLRMQMRLFFEP